MGSWPLAQPLFYQYKRTVGSANVLQGNGSTQSWSMRRRAWRQINNLSRFNPGGPTGRAAARGNLGHHPSPINAGECPVTAAAGERPCPPPPHRTRSGGRRRLADARHGAAGARLKDGRRRPKPCGACKPAAAPHRRRTARDSRETRALGPGQNGWTWLQSALTHAHTRGTRGLKPLCSLALSLAGKKKSSRHCREPLLSLIGATGFEPAT